MSRSPHEEPNAPNRTLLTEGSFVLKEPIDLTNCDKEPIHIPGLIQPHGVLLAVTPDADCLISQCSGNTEAMLGLTPERLLGRSLRTLMDDVQVNAIFAEGMVYDSARLTYMDFKLNVAGLDTDFCGILHESDGLLVLELEPVSGDQPPRVHDFGWIQTFFQEIKRSSNRIEASQTAADQVKEMLGYDRVMIYEFDEHWNGKVIAEAKEADMEPFLGHHYPASDIPKQARQLYLRNWLRIIVDVDYVPVPVTPILHPLTGQPLNLSLSVLRSVSPLHLEYLRNMEVGATLTISLIHDNELWGLITCHHRSPKYVPHRLRNLCNFLGSFYSSELYQRQQLDDYEFELKLKTAANRISSLFVGGSDQAAVILERLREEKSALLSLMSASGAAISFRGELELVGDTPSQAQVRALAAWAAAQADNHVYHTSALSAELPEAAEYKGAASGALYLALSTENKDYLMWFRQEVIQVFDWAGDPAKAVIQADDGVRLSPRKSFEKWKQVVQGTALPWKAGEIRVLADLKSIIFKQTEFQLRQAEEQFRQQTRITQQNEERYLQLMELSPVAFLAVAEDRILYANRQANQLIHAGSAIELTGKSFLGLVPRESRNRLEREFARLLSERVPISTVTERFNDLAGKELRLEISLARIVYQGSPAVIAIAREAAREVPGEESRAEMTDQLQRLLHTDSLTELPNRRAFEERLEEAWNAGLRDAEPISVALVDIDDFADYNALYGYNGADHCLQWLAEAFTAVGEAHGVEMARYGGGMFAFLAFEMPLASTVKIAERIRQTVVSLQIPHKRSDGNDHLTVSCGMAGCTPIAGTSPAELVAAAAEALYSAKSAGRNRVATRELN